MKPVCVCPPVCRVAVVSKSFEGQTDKTEEWYGTHYKQEPISEEILKVRLTRIQTRQFFHIFITLWPFLDFTRPLLILNMRCRRSDVPPPPSVQERKWGHNEIGQI